MDHKDYDAGLETKKHSSVGTVDIRAMSSILFGDTMVPNITPIMENQMEKNMEHEMETGIT